MTVLKHISDTRVEVAEVWIVSWVEWPTSYAADRADCQNTSQQALHEFFAMWLVADCASSEGLRLLGRWRPTCGELHSSAFGEGLAELISGSSRSLLSSFEFPWLKDFSQHVY